MAKEKNEFTSIEISKKDRGFVIVQSDMTFIKSSDINKIYNSIKIIRILYLFYLH